MEKDILKEIKRYAPTIAKLARDRRNSLFRNYRESYIDKEFPGEMDMLGGIISLMESLGDSAESDAGDKDNKEDVYYNVPRC